MWPLFRWKLEMTVDTVALLLPFHVFSAMFYVGDSVCSSLQQFHPSSLAVLGVCPTRQGAPEGKCWASALCRSCASPSCPIPQTSVLRPLGGPVAPALTGVEVLELGPQWCAALHSPWGPARPALPQKAPGWHNWQSSTWVALGAS